MKYLIAILVLAVPAFAMDWTQPELTNGACNARLAALSAEKDKTINDFNDALTQAYERINVLKNACGKKCAKL